VFADPVVENYRLHAVSPLLDHGPDPGAFDGTPCTDLDGGPRLRDHDGDGWAQTDPGAYERVNEVVAPPEVHGLVWMTGSELRWTPVEGAPEYHLYRAPLDTLVFSSFGVCADGLDAVRSDASMTDDEVPPPGEGFYYQVTTEDGSGAESTLGVGTCAERTNFTPCR
jgi:hypothetical protein